jgi:hypothetical protein
MEINTCFLLVKKEVRTSQKLYSSNPVNTQPSPLCPVLHQKNSSLPFLVRRISLLMILQVWKKAYNK